MNSEHPEKPLSEPTEQCPGGYSCTCCGSNCDCGCINKCLAAKKRRKIWENWTFWGTPRYDDHPIQDHNYENPERTKNFNDVTEFVQVMPDDPSDPDLVVQLAKEICEQGMASSDGRKAIVDDELICKLYKALK